jgi:hypothetical protein
MPQTRSCVWDFQVGGIDHAAVGILAHAMQSMAIRGFIAHNRESGAYTLTDSGRAALAAILEDGWAENKPRWLSRVLAWLCHSLRRPLPCLGILTVAQHAALDLACCGLRQLVHELNLPWVLVWCRDALHVFLDLLRQKITPCDPRPQNNECLHDLAAFGVGAADDRAFLHRLVLYYRVLNLDRPDSITSGIDHVIGAACAEISVAPARARVRASWGLSGWRGNEGIGKL